MKTLLNRFIRDEAGTTAIEYGLIASLISVAVIGALGALNTGLTNTFTTVKNKLG